MVNRTFGAAEIIAVGSELLTAHRVDTNSLFLTGRLNDLGIVVRTKTVVGDNADDLAAALRTALSRADVVLTTGGLGPTADDVTRDVAAAVLGLPLAEDQAILTAIRARFDRRGVRMPEINQRQAMVPSGAQPMANANGTAPGLLIETDGPLLVLLPGPPRELQPMFEAEVVPRLARSTSGRQLVRRTIRVTGRSESQVEEVAQPIYARLGDADVIVSTTILAMPGQIELHLTASGLDRSRLDATLDAAVTRIAGALGPPVFSVDGRTLEATVGDMLRARHLRIAAAESCTGGLLLGRLTDVPGSSAWVVGGIVAYDNAVKTEELGVDRQLIAEHGAVSERVARAMAEGVRARLHADVGVAVTGIAGPAGGSAEKPVGTVAVAVAYTETAVRLFLFPGDREAVRRHAIAAALDMVRRALQTS